MSDIAEARALDIGRVIQETFAVLGRHLATFLVLAVVIVGLPTAVLRVLQYSALRTSIATMSFGATAYWSFMGVLVALVAGTVLQATIIYGAASDLNQRPFSVADALAVGLRALLPLLGLGLLLGIAISIGFMLLIVPGVLMALAWCVAVPAYVVEQPPILSCFERSADLTRGNRLRILGLFALWVVAAIVVGVVVGIVGMVFSFASGGFAGFINAAIFQPLISVLSSTVGAVGAAVLYVELRRVREGIGPQALASIFD